jgi:ABC-2 type transport system ATP-binding protein
MNTSPVVSIHALHKQFDQLSALRDINLDIYPGSIVGLVGANGCGKSTLLRHIVGLYLPSGGSCRTFGTDSGLLEAPQLGRIGYVHQEGRLISWMTVRRLIRYVAAHYPQWNHRLEADYLKRFDLDTTAIVGTLSPGKRQQLAILLALGFEPDLLILDEPAAALDPIARTDFLHLLLDFINDGRRSVVISSHILTDIEKIIDRVVVMDRGAVLRNCDFDELQEEFIRIRVRAIDGLLPHGLPFSNVLACERNDYQAVLTMKNPGAGLEALCSSHALSFERVGLAFEEIYRLVIQGAADRRVTQ